MSAPVVDLEMEGSRAAETLMEKHLNASLASKPGFTGSMSVPVPVASKPAPPVVVPVPKKDLQRQNAQFFEFKLSENLQRFAAVPGQAQPVEPLPREVTLTVTLKFHCYFLLVWNIFFKFIGWQGKATC